MHSQKLSIDKLPKIPKMAADKAKKAAEKGLSIIGKRMVDAAIQLTARKNAVATKTYIKSFKFKVTAKSVTLINTSPYALFVEHGRPPGKPPPRGAIINWLRRKEAGKFSAKNWNELKRVAYVIAKKIGAQGTNPASHHKILTEVTESVDIKAELTKHMKGAK